MKDKIICLNGSFFSAEMPLFKESNRSFRYGDALFETMLWRNKAIRFFDDHYLRLTQSMSLLAIEEPKKFKENLEQSINKLRLLNQIQDQGVARLQVYRAGKGAYKPESHEAQWVISLTAFKNEAEPMSLSCGIYPDIKKNINVFSGIKSANGLLYVMASQYAKTKQWDETILINEEGFVCEGSSNNIFIVKDHKIITPPLSSGCLAGVFRKNLISHLNLQKSDRLKIQNITIAELKAAEEIWFSNSVHGIRVAKSLENKAFKSTPLFDQIKPELLKL